MTVRPGKFSIDDSPLFDGYTNGNTWNGFATPSFTKEQAETVLNYSIKNYLSPGRFADLDIRHKHEQCWTYDPTAFLFLIYDSNNEDADNGESGVLEAPHTECTTADGTKVVLYDVTDGWCWDEDETDLPKHLVCITFTPTDNPTSDYPFPEHKASQREQITKPRRDIQIMSLSDYEQAIDSLPAYAGRRGAEYQIEILAENLTVDEILVLSGSCQKCLK